MLKKNKNKGWLKSFLIFPLIFIPQLFASIILILFGFDLLSISSGKIDLRTMIFLEYIMIFFMLIILYFCMKYIDKEKNAKKLFVGEIKNGIKHGLWTRYWDNGNKKAEGLYKNSFKEELWIEWFKNGNKYLEILYKRDSITHFTNCVKENCN